MNTVWSKHVQGTRTLYYTRKLRFDDRFAAQFKALFSLDEKKSLKILEIGCGPGALAQALHRWYPDAQITAIDRDSEFIRFAKEQEPAVRFLEGDATALPFADGSFDVTISNTVSEHVEPSAFFGEQLRVLKPGGVCLVLSSRKGIHLTAPCLSLDEKTEHFWEKAAQYDDTMEKYAVCRYPMSEAELPAAMEQYGFARVTTGYAAVDLTPDDPKYPPKMAHAMINAHRWSDLDAVRSVLDTFPEHFTAEEIEEIERLTDERYDARIALYDRGEKQWDTTVSVIMAVRGEK